MEVSNQFLVLPNEVNKYILSSLDEETCKTAEFVCRQWNKIINTIDGYDTKKENYFAKKLVPSFELFTEKDFINIDFVDIFGGIKGLCSLPVLDISSVEHDFFEEFTQITPGMMAKSIMRGVDDNKSPFIAIKVLSQEDFGVQTKAFTIFRCVWTDFRCTPDSIFGSSRGISKEETKNIKNLICEGSLSGADYNYKLASKKFLSVLDYCYVKAEVKEYKFEH